MPWHPATSTVNRFAQRTGTVWRDVQRLRVHPRIRPERSTAQQRPIRQRRPKARDCCHALILACRNVYTSAQARPPTITRHVGATVALGHPRHRPCVHAFQAHTQSRAILGARRGGAQACPPPSAPGWPLVPVCSPSPLLPSAHTQNMHTPARAQTHTQTLAHPPTHTHTSTHTERQPHQGHTPLLPPAVRPPSQCPSMQHMIVRPISARQSST